MLKTLLTWWRNFLLHKLDIRQGDYRRVWLMQLNVFLLIQCLWIIKPIVNAQFLSRLGIEKLPSAFLMVALTALVVSVAYSRLLRRISLGTIIGRTYLVFICMFLMFALLMHLNLFSDWMSYLFYISVALFGLISTSQFWLLGNLVFNSLEAKRLFGIIGAGAIAGGISGGYLTSTFAPLIESQNLLFIAVVLLLISMLVSRKIWVTFISDTAPSIQLRQSNHFHEYPFHFIWSSRHLTFLALIMGISVVVDKLVEFQFSSIAYSEIQDPDKLTAFFGFWFSTANVVSLFFQLVITQRLIAFLGVGRSLFVFPGTLLAGAVMVFNSPVLWAGTTLKIIDISLKQSINKAATELLILPIPLAIKSQAKTFIDVFVDTTATGIGGILLIFIINAFNLSVQAVCVMIMVLIGIWIYFAIRVQKEYVKTFQEILGISGKKPGRKRLHLGDADVIKGIRRALSSGTTDQIIFLLERIEESKNLSLMPDLIPLLNHNSPKVRQSALRCLYFHTDHTIIKKIEPLLKDPDEEVRTRAFSCLLAHTRIDRLRLINEYLVDEDPAIRGAALVGLATEASDNPQLQKLFNIEELIQEKITAIAKLHTDEDIRAYKKMVMRIIGYGKIKSHYPLLITYMHDKDPEICKQALMAAGSSQDLSLVSILLTYLTNKSTRSQAQKAIGKYEPSQLLPLISDLMYDKNLNQDLLVQLPALAKRMNSQLAIDYLLRLANHDNYVVRTKALKVLHVMKAKYPHLRIFPKRILSFLRKETKQYIDMVVMHYAAQHIESFPGVNQELNSIHQDLILLIERKRNNLLKNIFLALGLIYTPGIMVPILKDLHSLDQNIRISAVELLDNVLKPLHKRIVLPVADLAITDLLSDEILNRYEIHIPTEFNFYKTILQGDDDQIKNKVLTFIKKQRSV